MVFKVNLFNWQDLNLDPHALALEGVIFSAEHLGSFSKHLLEQIEWEMICRSEDH